MFSVRQEVNFYYSTTVQFQQAYIAQNKLTGSHLQLCAGAVTRCMTSQCTAATRSRYGSGLTFRRLGFDPNCRQRHKTLKPIVRGPTSISRNICISQTRSCSVASRWNYQLPSNIKQQSCGSCHTTSTTRHIHQLNKVYG